MKILLAVPIAIVHYADQMSKEVDPQEITGNHMFHSNLDLIFSLIISEEILRFLDLNLEMDP